MKKKYDSIDIFKLIFACLIPLLHISSLNEGIIPQYISRLGVPFFFAVSGMFLSTKIDDGDRIQCLIKYEKRIVLLLLVWCVIYCPLFYVNYRCSDNVVQQFIFKTPGYLWYCTALIVAAIPFCLIKNRTVLYISCVILYIGGVLFSENYIWLIGKSLWIQDTILTTRNGIMFALPLMIIGELAIRGKNKFKVLIVGFILSVSLYIFEVTFIGTKVDNTMDRSLYFTLPIVIYFLDSILIKMPQPGWKTAGIRSLSTAIYVMQYGVIHTCQLLSGFFQNPLLQSGLFVYIMVIVIPLIMYLILRKTKIITYVF